MKYLNDNIPLLLQAKTPAIRMAAAVVFCSLMAVACSGIPDESLYDLIALMFNAAKAAYPL